MMRLMRFIFISMSCAAILACSSDEGPKAGAAGNAMPVIVANVLQKDAPQVVQVFASLYAENDAKISSEISGNIAKVSFKAGDWVPVGTVLMNIDSRTQEAKLQQAQADAELSKVELDRAQNLYHRGAQSKQELDKAQATFKAQQAAVAIAKADVDKTIIIAPFSGRLGAKTLSIGDYVSPGTFLLEIVDKKHLKIQYTVPERYLPDLAVGQMVQIKSIAFPNDVFAGVVDFVSPFVDKDTRTVQVEALVPNEDERLSPGLSASVVHSMGVDPKALVIPEEALVPSIEGLTVFRVVNDEKNQTARVQKVSVEVGSRYQGLAQIRSGLEATDQVVTQGQQKLRDGAMIKIITPEMMKQLMEPKAAGVKPEEDK